MSDAEREALFADFSGRICVSYTLRARRVRTALGVGIATIGALLASSAAAHDRVESFVPQGEVPGPSRPAEMEAWDAQTQYARGPAGSKRRPFSQPSAVGGVDRLRLRWLDERE